MKKIFLLSLCSLIIFLIFSEKNIFAAKRKIVRKITSTSSNSASGSRMIIKPTLRSDRKGLIVNFSNLNVVSNFTYELTYTGDGLPQGASGTVAPEESLIQRELLFGTCSKNVCRYHSGNKDMRFVVTYTLKTGSTYRKTYSIRP